MKNIQLFKGDALEVMDELIAKGVVVDAIITDPPYNTTACHWDKLIPFPEMWLRLNKLIKPSGAIVLFGSEPFSSALRISNIKNYKYDWVWVKKRPVGFANAKKRPLKLIENIIVFNAHHSLYNPQDLIRIDKKITNSKSTGGDTTGKFNYGCSYTQEFTNYPKEIIMLGLDEKKKLHPTQKPVALMEYLIKTYTNENELVLDFTMGSGTTGVACKNLNRNFIGIEMDDKYCDIAKNRIEDTVVEKGLLDERT